MQAEIPKIIGSMKDLRSRIIQARHAESSMAQESEDGQRLARNAGQASCAPPPVTVLSHQHSPAVLRVSVYASPCKPTLQAESGCSSKEGITTLATRRT